MSDQLPADLRDLVRRARDEHVRARVDYAAVERAERDLDRVLADRLVVRIAGRADFPATKSIDVEAHLHGVALVVVKALSHASQ